MYIHILYIAHIYIYIYIYRPTPFLSGNHLSNTTCLIHIVACLYHIRHRQRNFLAQSLILPRYFCSSVLGLPYIRGNST